jgi:hypothetical protein
MPDTWAALYITGLGALHGLNPAMGWLFAGALGVDRQSHATVIAALLPIAIGHALSIAVGAGLMVAAGVIISADWVRVGCAVVLAGWAIVHWRWRHSIRLGSQAGLMGLAAWSFLVATAHGAGVMLWPALMPACLSADAGATALGAPVAAALTGVAIHTVAMLGTTALMASLVYEGAGLAVVHRAWLSIDRIWPLALAGTAVVLLAF